MSDNVLLKLNFLLEKSVKSSATADYGRNFMHSWLSRNEVKDQNIVNATQSHNQGQSETDLETDLVGTVLIEDMPVDVATANDVECPTLITNEQHNDCNVKPQSESQLESEINDSLRTTIRTACEGEENAASKNEHVSKRQQKALSHFHKGGRHYVKCIPCSKCNDSVRLHSRNNKIPPIAQDSGTIYRQITVSQHLKTAYHMEAVKAYRLNKMKPADAVGATSVGRLIIRSQKALANRIGGLLINVYNDAKRLTLSGNSFPSRIIASELAASFNISEANSDEIRLQKFSEGNLQYLSPNGHHEFLESIVASHKQEIVEKIISDSIALSIRCDGSVDRTQIDKMYVMAKTVSKTGEENLYFLGEAEPTERGSVGMLDAVKAACSSVLGKNTFTKLIKHASSFVTDGATANTGLKGGLWSLMQALRMEDSNDSPAATSPLLTIWCAVHRTNLAWSSVCETVSEVGQIFTQLISICSYFHKSGLRSRELRQKAEENSLTLLRLPRTFEVRWTEFTSDLLNAILTSWNALVMFYQQSEDKAAAGFLKFLTDIDNLQIIAFLADVLAVFSRYQQKLQSDSCTIVDVVQHTQKVTTKLRSLSTTPLLGGWVNALESQLEKKDDSIQLKGFTLHRVERRRKQHHLFVTDHRETTAITTEVIYSLVEFLTQRLSIDDSLVAAIKPFVELNKAADLSRVHKLICFDLDLQQFGLEYEELMECDNIQDLQKKPLREVHPNCIIIEFC